MPAVLPAARLTNVLFLYLATCLIDHGPSNQNTRHALVPDPAGLLSPVILVFAAHTKQFKDSNFNVLKAAFGAVSTLLEACQATGAPKGSHAAVSIVLSPAMEKLGDRKLQVERVVFIHVHSCPLPKFREVVAFIFPASSTIYSHVAACARL